MQKRFTTFRAPVNSFPLGEMTVGTMKPGRYNGFDTLNILIGLTFELAHEADNNVKKTNIDGENINFGAILTPDGTVIHESEPIPLVVDNNVGIPNPRKDLVVCEHEYIQVVGGQPAFYFVIKGNNDGDIPTLPNPEKQVAIGVITMPAGASTLVGATWEPNNDTIIVGDYTISQLFGLINGQLPNATTEQRGIIELATNAEAIARTDQEKAITPASAIAMVPTEAVGGMARKSTEAEAKAGTNTIAYITPEWMRLYGRLHTIIKYDTNGSMDIPADWNGKVISLAGDGAGTPLITFNIPTGLPTNFHCRILCYTQKVKFINAVGVTFLLPSNRSAETNQIGTELSINNVGVINQYIFHGDMKQTTADNFGYVPKWGAIPYFPVGNSLAEFDGTGLGISGDKIGWAICNGANGTRNLTGAVLIQLDPNEAVINQVGKTTGSKIITLVRSMLPNFRLKLVANAAADISATLLSSNPDNRLVRRGTGEGSSDHDYTFGSATTEATLGTSESVNGNVAQTDIDSRQLSYTTLYIQRIV